MSNFEEEYLEVLQNIEASIIAVYRTHRELADYQVDAAIEALGRTYIGEARGKNAVLPKNPLALEVYQAVKSTCDWRMGRENMVDETGQPLPSDEMISVDEVLACLKRIRKSISMWNKEAGSKGYLSYISQFLS
jgi:hypothetical protein